MVRLIDAKGLYELVCEYVSKDPVALLKKGQERLTIPTSAKDLVWVSF